MATILRCLKGMKLTGNTAQKGTHHRIVNLIKIPCTRHESSFKSSQQPAESIEYVGKHQTFINQLLNAITRNYARQSYTLSEQIYCVIENLKITGYIQSNYAILLLRCCGKPAIDITSEQRKLLTQDIIDTLDLCNVVKDLMYYNVLLQVKIENNCEFSPSEVLEEMKSHMVEPNDQTYTNILEYYCKAGNIAEANNIVKIMEDLKYPLTQKIYRLLIIGHTEAGDIKSAENILDSMRDADIVPDNYTYTALMCGYAKTGDMDNIRRMLSESGHTVFINQNFLDIAHALIVNKHSEHVDEVLCCLKEPNMIPDAEVQFIGNLIELKELQMSTDMFINIAPKIKLYKSVDLFLYSVLRRLMNVAKEDPDNVLDMCIHIDKNCDLPQFIDSAIKASFEIGNINLTYSLLEHKMRKGEEIKPHFFWPLMARARLACDIKDVISVVDAMVNRFRVTPCIQTLVVYIVPCIFGSSEACRMKLLEYGIPTLTVDTAIVTELLNRNKLLDAQCYMKRYSGPYEYDTFKYYLKRAVIATNDTLNYFILINTLNTAGISNVGTTEKAIFLNRSYNPYLEDSLMDILGDGFKNKRVFFKIIETCWACNTMLSESLISSIYECADDNISPHISKILTMMLKLPTMPEYVFAFLNSVMSNLSFVKFDTSLIFQIYNENDEDLMINVLELLELRNIELSPRSYVRILRFFCNKKNLAKAQEQVLKLRNKKAIHYLNRTVVLQYVELAVLNDAFDEAKEFLQELVALGIRATSSDFAEMSEGLVKEWCEKITQPLINAGKIDVAQEFFKCFAYLKYIDDAVINSPVALKYYIEQSDVKMALASFVAICKISSVLPHKHSLTNLIVKQKDGVALQKLIDACVTVQDKEEVVSGLVMDLVTLDHVDAAMGLYERHNTLFQDSKTKHTLTKYLEQYDEDELEALYNNVSALPKKLQATLCSSILHVYVQRNDWKNALIMWNHMQKHDYVFTDTFANDVKELLQRNEALMSNLPSEGSVQDVTNGTSDEKKVLVR